MKKALLNRSISLAFGLIVAMIFILSGCKNAQQKKESEVQNEDASIPKEAVIEKLSGYPVPDSYEITKLIYESGAPYILSLSNSPAKAGDYITNRDKVLNLGVYAADLCYSTTYMMKQGTMNYLQATKTLIDDLGISTTFNITYAERIERNMDDRDSLIMIVSESFSDTWDYLVDNEQDVMARLVVCGSWIEGIYITTNVALKAKDNTEFLKILAKQKNSLDQLVSILEPVKDVDDVTDIFKGLFDLQDIYQDVGDKMTDKQLEQVSVRIDALRSDIV